MTKLEIVLAFALLIGGSAIGVGIWSYVHDKLRKERIEDEPYSEK